MRQTLPKTASFPLGIPGRTLRWATGAGVAAGAAYAFSPLTVLFAAAAAGLFRWAGRGLPGEERRWVFGALGAAIALRVLAIVVLFFLTDPEKQHFNILFGDAAYAITRSLWIRNLWLGIPIGPYVQAAYEPYGASEYFYWLAFLQTVFGSAPYSLNLVSVGVFLAGVVVLYRLLRDSYGSEPALVGFCLLLFWPTLFAWSISLLKEPMHFGLAATTVAATVSLLRAARWSARVLPLALVIGGFAMLAGLRSGAFAITAFGLSAGLLARAATLRPWIGVLVSMSLVLGGAGSIASRDVQNRIRDEIQMAANRHMGHVTTGGLTGGFSYRALDQRIYSEGPAAVFTMRPAELVRFVLRSAIAFVLAPAPWDSASRADPALVPLQTIWYLLVLLAIAGFARALRRDTLLTFLFTGIAAAGAVAVALNSGNIGTLIRHRDIIVPFVICLTSVGACSVTARASPLMAHEPRHSELALGPSV